MPRLFVLVLCCFSFSLSAQYLSDLQEDFDYYQRVVQPSSSSKSAITPETFALLNETALRLQQSDTSLFEKEDWLLYQNIYLAIAEMPADYRKMGELEALARAISAAPKHWPLEKAQNLSIWWQYSKSLLTSLNGALSTTAYRRAATHLIVLSEIQDFLQAHPQEAVEGKSLESYSSWLGTELSRLYADLARHFRQQENYQMAADMLNYGHHFYSNSRLIQEELVALYLATEQIARAKLHLSILIREHADAPEALRKRWYFQRGTLHLQPPTDYGIAQLSFEKALELDPQYFEALFNMAQTYLAQSNFALENWEQNTEESDRHKAAYYHYLAKARDYLKQAQAVKNTAQVQRLLEQIQLER